MITLYFRNLFFREICKLKLKTVTRSMFRRSKRVKFPQENFRAMSSKVIKLNFFKSILKMNLGLRLILLPVGLDK